MDIGEVEIEQMLLNGKVGQRNGFVGRKLDRRRTPRQRRPYSCLREAPIDRQYTEIVLLGRDTDAEQRTRSEAAL